MSHSPGSVVTTEQLNHALWWHQSSSTRLCDDTKAGPPGSVVTPEQVVQVTWWQQSRSIRLCGDNIPGSPCSVVTPEQANQVLCDNRTCPLGYVMTTEQVVQIMWWHQYKSTRFCCDIGAGQPDSVVTTEHHNPQRFSSEFNYPYTTQFNYPYTTTI
jgi:hypothetical protein